MNTTHTLTPARKALLEAARTGDVFDHTTANGRVNTYYVEYRTNIKHKVSARIRALAAAGLVHQPTPPKWQLTETGSELLYPTRYLATLQFTWGGLIGGTFADHLAHLVRGTDRGTPGPTLCGIDRFANGGPGFNVGGGVTPYGVIFDACAGCVTAAQTRFPGLPVAGMKSMSTRLAEAIGVQAYCHAMDVPKGTTRA